MGCGASSPGRVEKGDVVCSRADRTRTGKVQDDDGTVGQDMMRVRWDGTGDVSDWLGSRDVAPLSDAELRQREERYGSILAQREEDERMKRQDEERKRREDEEERKKREEEQRKTREEERKKREEQERKKREEEKSERETYIVAGEAAVAFARKRLGNCDIEEAKEARAKAALEYGQAKEDRTSEIAVRMFILSKSKGTYLYIHTYMNSCTRFTCRLYCNGPRNLKEIIIDLKRQNHCRSWIMQFGRRRRERSWRRRRKRERRRGRRWLKQQKEENCQRSRAS